MRILDWTVHLLVLLSVAQCRQLTQAEQRLSQLLTDPESGAEGAALKFCEENDFFPDAALRFPEDSQNMAMIPFLMLIEQDSSNLLRCALSKGVNPDGGLADGDSALIHATLRQQMDVVEELLQANACVNQFSDMHTRVTALHIAAGNANHIVSLLNELLSSHDTEHVELLFEDEMDYIAQMDAAAAPVLETILRNVKSGLLGSGGSVKLTELLYLANIKNAAIVQLLLHHGAANVHDVSGITPLHVAIRLGNLEAVKLMLNSAECFKGGALERDNSLLQAIFPHEYVPLEVGGIDAEDIFGTKPIDIAYNLGFTEIVERLESLGAHRSAKETVSANSQRAESEITAAGPIAEGWAHTLSDSNDNICDFDVVDTLLPAEFARRYYSAGKPVLIRGALRSLLDAAQWKRDNLVESFGNETILMTNRTPAGPSEDDVPIALSEFVEQYLFQEAPEDAYLIEEMVQHNLYVSDLEMPPPSSPPPPPPQFYNEEELVTDEPVHEDHQPFQDFETFLPNALPASLNITAHYPAMQVTDTVAMLIMGMKGSGTSSRVSIDGWHGVVAGEVQWFLQRPGQAWYSQTPVWDDITSLNQDTMTCIQRSGDILFIPALWGHSKLHTVPTVSVAVNFQFSVF